MDLNTQSQKSIPRKFILAGKVAKAILVEEKKTERISACVMIFDRNKDSCTSDSDDEEQPKVYYDDPKVIQLRKIMFQLY